MSLLPPSPHLIQSTALRKQEDLTTEDTEGHRGKEGEKVESRLSSSPVSSSPCASFVAAPARVSPSVVKSFSSGWAALFVRGLFSPMAGVRTRSKEEKMLRKRYAGSLQSGVGVRIIGFSRSRAEERFFEFTNEECRVV